MSEGINLDKVIATALSKNGLWGNANCIGNEKNWRTYPYVHGNYSSREPIKRLKDAQMDLHGAGLTLLISREPKKGENYENGYFYLSIANEGLITKNEPSKVFTEWKYNPYHRKGTRKIWPVIAKALKMIGWYSDQIPKEGFIPKPKKTKPTSDEEHRRRAKDYFDRM